MGIVTGSITRLLVLLPALLLLASRVCFAAPGGSEYVYIYLPKQATATYLSAYN